MVVAKASHEGCLPNSGLSADQNEPPLGGADYLSEQVAEHRQVLRSFEELARPVRGAGR
jgi:hypothetical protein